jgi:glycosyltransferase involved in cell wall biosynthesis
MRILIWHVHKAWMTAFVQGPHQYLVPVLPYAGGAGGRVPEWPDSVIDVLPEQAAAAGVDAVVMQRPRELELLAEWYLGGRRPGREVPAIYLEHSTPQGRINEMRHPAADRSDLTLVHVTHFNALLWDSGSTPVQVIEHGIPDPGYRYTGELARAGVVINEPERRARVTGTDLLDGFGKVAPVDLFGIGSRDLSQDRLHDELARRRLYVHPYRWTSLGLSLLEAMHLGMPVLALASTEAPRAVPASAGVVSSDVRILHEAASWLMEDPDAARRLGRAAREHACHRHGLARFLADWDRLLDQVACHPP